MCYFDEVKNVKKKDDIGDNKNGSEKEKDEQGRRKEEEGYSKGYEYGKEDRSSRCWVMIHVRCT